MARILKETSAVKDYWLEPDSRKVEPESLAVTDLKGNILQKVPYSPHAGLEIRFALDRCHGVLIDFGKEVGGYPNITFGTGRCRRLGVQAVESMSHFVSPLLADPASYTNPTFMGGNIKAREGKRVRLSHFGGFRYLWLYPKRRGRITIREIWLDYTPHLTADIDSCGYFLSSDELLNRMWFAGLHTIEMCTVEPALGGTDGNHRIGEGEWVLIDGAKRDRLIWIGDLSPMTASIAVSNFCTEAVRDSLLSLARHQDSSGYIPACSPGPLLGRIASGFFGDYVAWWIVCLYQYYLHTGDRETIEEMLPVLKRALHYMHSQCRGGLFRQTPFNMMEWCFSVLRRGKPAYTNIMYYWALNCASFLAHELGDERVSSGFVSRAFRLGEVLERSLWDDERGAFVDTSADRSRVPQDANSIAIVSGLISEPAAAEGILEYMKRNMWEDWGSTNVDIPYYKITPGLQPHNKRVLPFMNNFEALARFTTGDNEGAMELIRRCWGNMVEQEPGSTFWEWVGRDGKVPGELCSLCHGWSAGVIPLLSKYVLGIRATGVAYERYRFDPRPMNLEWVEGRVPTPKGFIEARIEKKKDGYEYVVNAPKGIERVS